MRGALVVAVVAAVCTANAMASPRLSPALEVAAGPRVSLISGAELLGRVAGTASLRAADRWHFGARVSVDINKRTQIFEPSGEVGLWLHASRSLDVLLAWRVGYAHFRFDNVAVHAFTAEAFAQIRYAFCATSELRITPLSPQAYLSGVWQFTLGGEVGVAWRW